MLRERRLVRGGDQAVERGDAVLFGVEQPRRVVDADEGVQREGLAQLRVARDPLAVFVDLAEQLVQLESDGFVARPIDAAPVPDDEPSVRAAAPATATVEDLGVLRARVTRALLDTIGPNGDDFAIRIERARSVDELRTLLPAILSVVEACGGRAGVDGFLQRGGAI